MSNRLTCYCFDFIHVHSFVRDELTLGVKLVTMAAMQAALGLGTGLLKGHMLGLLRVLSRAKEPPIQ